MKVNKERMKNQIDEIVNYAAAHCEECDLTVNKVMQVIEPLILAVEAISQMQTEWVAVTKGYPEIGAQCYFYRMGISDFVYTGKYNGVDQWGSTYFKEEDKPAYYRDVTHYSVFSKPQPPTK